MEKILQEINIHHYLIAKKSQKWTGDDPSIAEVLGHATHLISESKNLNIRAIVTSTRTGSTTRLIAKCRTEVPIIAGTPYKTLQRQLQLLWGVYPIPVKVTPSYEELLYEIVLNAPERGLLKVNDTIIAVGGSLLGFPSKTNMIQIMKVEDVLLFGQQLQKVVM